MMKKLNIVYILLLGALLLSSSKATPFTVKEDKKVKPLTKEIVYVSYPQIPKRISKELLQHITDECKKNNVPVVLFLKLIEHESHWNINQKTLNYDKSGKNVVSIDYGLCQLNSLYIEEFLWFYRDRGPNPKKYLVMTNPKDNVTIGVRHLANLYKQTRVWGLAIQAYNCGLTKVRSGAIPNTTKKYKSIICPVEFWWNEPEGVKILY